MVENSIDSKSILIVYQPRNRPAGPYKLAYTQIVLKPFWKPFQDDKHQPDPKLVKTLADSFRCSTHGANHMYQAMEFLEKSWSDIEVRWCIASCNHN